MGTIKGKIVAYYTVWCARCEVFETPEGHTKKEVARIIQRLGWRNTASGWICPECSGALPVSSGGSGLTVMEMYAARPAPEEADRE